MTTEAGRATADLAARADLVVGFRPGVLDALGLGYAELRARRRNIDPRFPRSATHRLAGGRTATGKARSWCCSRWAARCTRWDWPSASRSRWRRSGAVPSPASAAAVA
ncbi:MAG: hypothetical protein U0531_09715 [Dehalococcoidia bacterium]